MTGINRLLLPVYEFDEVGAIKPNLIFHRTFDKLHSRCIEYPFAASRLSPAQVILDVGSAKADPEWIRWLESLPLEVHATDYDLPLVPYTAVRFERADIRRLPYPEGMFDVVLAVSVIEHVGLENPQVNSTERPACSKDGDLHAFQELVRVLKPNGRLVMTVPFGISDGLVLGDQARCYTLSSIKRFEAFAQLVTMEYYEYQFREYPCLYAEHEGASQREAGACRPSSELPRLQDHCGRPGLVTWRRIDPIRTAARHIYHCDGVVCGVWEKQSRSSLT